MCIHMYVQAELEYELIGYELPEHSPTEEDIREPEEHEAEEAEELATREAPDIPAEDKTPAESEVAKEEVTAVAAPEDTENPPGEPPARVEVSITMEEPTGGDKVWIHAATTEVPAASEEPTEVKPLPAKPHSEAKVAARASLTLQAERPEGLTTATPIGEDLPREAPDNPTKNETLAVAPTPAIPTEGRSPETYRRAVLKLTTSCLRAKSPRRVTTHSDPQKSDKIYVTQSPSHVTDGRVPRPRHVNLVSHAIPVTRVDTTKSNHQLPTATAIPFTATACRSNLVQNPEGDNYLWLLNNNRNLSRSPDPQPTQWSGLIHQPRTDTGQSRSFGPQPPQGHHAPLGQTAVSPRSNGPSCCRRASPSGGRTPYE